MRTGISSSNTKSKQTNKKIRFSELLRTPIILDGVLFYSIRNALPKISDIL